MRYLLALSLAAVPAFAADLTGNWQFEGDVDGHPLAMECALKQDGAKLAGTCKSAERPGWTIAGDVTEQKIAFSYTIDYEGTTYTLQYTGKIDEAGAGLTGEIQVAGTAGTFSAKKT